MINIPHKHHNNTIKPHEYFSDSICRNGQNIQSLLRQSNTQGSFVISLKLLNPRVLVKANKMWVHMSKQIQRIQPPGVVTSQSAHMACWTKSSSNEIRSWPDFISLARKTLSSAKSWLWSHLQHPTLPNSVKIIFQSLWSTSSFNICFEDVGL